MSNTQRSVQTTTSGPSGVDEITSVEPSSVFLAPSNAEHQSTSTDRVAVFYATHRIPGRSTYLRATFVSRDSVSRPTAQRLGTTTQAAWDKKVGKSSLSQDVATQSSRPQTDEINTHSHDTFHTHGSEQSVGECVTFLMERFPDAVHSVSMDNQRMLADLVQAGSGLLVIASGGSEDKTALIPWEGDLEASRSEVMGRMLSGAAAMGRKRFVKKGSSVVQYSIEAEERMRRPWWRIEGLCLGSSSSQDIAPRSFHFEGAGAEDIGRFFGSSRLPSVEFDGTGRLRDASLEVDKRGNEKRRYVTLFR